MNMSDGLIDFENEEHDDDEVTVKGAAPGESEDDDTDDEVDLKAALEEGDYGKEDEESEESEEAEEASPEPEGESEEESEEESEAFKNEENARNAERRRQNEQRLMERLKVQAPEFALAQQLANHFGKPVEELLRDVQMATLNKQAQQEGVPVEYLQRQQATEQRLAQLEQERIVAEYQNWQNKMSQETSTLKNEYPMLSDDDFSEAQDYILNTVQNLNVSLEEAILAKHGKKILKGQQEAARNEALAQASGRKSKGVIPPKSGTSDSGKELLTAAEKAAAKLFGMSEDEYLKYR